MSSRTLTSDADLEVREGSYGAKVGAVEPGGAEFIPLDERHGTARGLFWTWMSPNLEFATIFVGVLGVLRVRPVVLAGGARRSCSARRSGALTHGVLSSRGPAAGVPEMVLSRVAVRLPRQRPAGRAQRAHRRHRLVRGQQRQRRAGARRR